MKHSNDNTSMETISRQARMIYSHGTIGLDEWSFVETCRSFARREGISKTSKTLVNWLIFLIKKGATNEL